MTLNQSYYLKKFKMVVVSNTSHTKQMKTVAKYKFLSIISRNLNVKSKGYVIILMEILLEFGLKFLRLKQIIVHIESMFRIICTFLGVPCESSFTSDSITIDCEICVKDATFHFLRHMLVSINIHLLYRIAFECSRKC